MSKLTPLTIILLALVGGIHQASSLTRDSSTNLRFYATKTSQQHEHETRLFYRHVHLVPAVEYIHLTPVVNQHSVPLYETNRNTFDAKFSKTADEGRTPVSKTPDEVRVAADKCECAPSVASMMSPASTVASANLAAWNSDITETILASVQSVEELDEALAQMQPLTLSVACNPSSNNNNGNNLELGISPLSAAPVQPAPVVGQNVAIHGVPIAVTNDGPARLRRAGTVVVSENSSSPFEEPFGMPVTRSPVVPVVAIPPTLASQGIEAMDEDFASAGKELKQIHNDLDRIVENLEKENNRLHSTLFKALRAYVASVQKRIEHQQKAYTDAKATGIRQKILVLKAKINETILKLKLKLTLRPLQTLTQAHGNPVVTSNSNVANNVELAPAVSNVVFNGPVNGPDSSRLDSAPSARPIATASPSSAVTAETPLVSLTPSRSV